MPDEPLRPLLLATTNPGKVRELRQILGDLPVRLLTPADLGLEIEVDEAGETFEENAALKARAYYAASGLPSLAEDSGFAIDCLEGQPGVHSARWEGDDYERKNRVVLDLLRGQQGIGRRCRYVAIMAFVDPRGRLHFARGEVVGRVAEAPAGSGGFGYDPIFLAPRSRRTLAQLSPAEKDAISHRGRAARRVRRHVERALADPAWPQQPPRG